MSARMRAAVALLALVLGLIAADGSAADSPCSVPWQSFSLKAEKMVGRITAEVQLDRVPAQPLPPGLWPAVRGEPLGPSGPTVQKLTIRVTIDPPGLPSLRMENRLWFDPVTGAPLRLIRTRSGMDDYVQWFVFGPEEVFRRQDEPANPAQAASPPENWTKVSRTAYAFRTESCPASSETSLVICTVSDAIARGTLDLPPQCVFHKRQLHRLTFQAERLERVSYAYLEQAGDGVQRRAGETGAVKIRIGATPIGFLNGKTEPWFKDAYLTISADGRLPLAVACDLPLVGHVEMRLDEIRFR